MSLSELIYLDNHSTTCCDRRVVQAMLPLLSENFGNPHSTTHLAGHHAQAATQAAIESIAATLGASPSEVILTSGATESNNLALLGHCLNPRNRRRHVITVVTEHPAVLDPAEYLERQGFRVTRLPVDSAGFVDANQVETLCDSQTAIVSIMYGNNEIGSLQNLESIIEIAHRHDVPVHTDATQAIGKLPIDLKGLAVDLLSASAHKFYGPKGTGLLFVRRSGRRARLQPLFHGGGQQRSLRPGTMNPAGVVGMATALEICLRQLDEESARITTLRDRLFAGLVEQIPELQLNGPPLDAGQRLLGNLNVCFPRVEGESLMIACPELAVSSGSACSSVDPRPSHVLAGIGRSEQQARSSLRFGIGRFNTEREIDRAIDMITAAYNRLIQLAH